MPRPQNEVKFRNSIQFSKPLLLAILTCNSFNISKHQITKS